MQANIIDADQLAFAATGRTRSLFTEDVERHRASIADLVSDKRVLVIGGAGSIGASTTELLVRFQPRTLHIVDISENALAELVRDFRSNPDLSPPADLRLLPIDFGSATMERLLRTEAPYDVVLNFAAHKHVRSEKDVPSVLQMLDTNVVKNRRLLSWLRRYGHGAHCFFVSTDKAANPTSVMGASKRLMEHVLFTGAAGTASSARFANVAFSNGSLPQAFLFRLARRQPIAVPRDVRRYFVSVREAGEICMLGAVGPNGGIAFPTLDPEENLRPLVDIAEAVLNLHGLEAAFYEDETAARTSVATEMGRGRYPVILTPLDTSGEKPYEEFVAYGEELIDTGFCTLRAVAYRRAGGALEDVLEFLERAVRDAEFDITKGAIVSALSSVVEGFGHVESGRSLDERA